MKTEPIVHRPDQHRFEMTIDDEISFISYIDRSGVYYLTHSEVPLAMRGKGIGKILVNKTLEYLQTHGIKAIPICSFIKSVAESKEKEA